MNSFVSKQILSSQTIGEQLAKARKGACLSIDDVSLKLGIKARYLSAIEFGLYAELPGEIYCKEFIKKYAQFLNINPSQAAKEYKKERAAPVNCNYKLSAHGKSYALISGPRFVGRAVLGLGVSIAAVYALIMGSYFFSGPSIIINTPAEYMEIDSSHITLQGKAKHAVQVFVNQEPIVLSKDGTFIESFNLPKGVNILNIRAVSRTGKQATEFRTIIVAQKPDKILVLDDI